MCVSGETHVHNAGIDVVVVAGVIFRIQLNSGLLTTNTSEHANYLTCTYIRTYTTILKVE